MTGRALTSCFAFDPASYERSAAAAVKWTGDLNDHFEIGKLCSNIGITTDPVIDTFRKRCFHSAWCVSEGTRAVVRGYKHIK